MTNSAPRDEREFVSSGETPLHRSAWGQKVRQPRSHEHKTRLAYVYWMATILGIFAGFISAFGMMVHLPLAYAVAFSVFILGQISFVLATLSTYRTHFEAANNCCISQAEVIRQLEKQNTDLLYDALKSGGAAAGLSRSENQEDSAAVVHQFPKPEGAA